MKYIKLKNKKVENKGDNIMYVLWLVPRWSSSTIP
jgi:hypothetical protein